MYAGQVESSQIFKFNWTCLLQRLILLKRLSEIIQNLEDAGVAIRLSPSFELRLLASRFSYRDFFISWYMQN